MTTTVPAVARAMRILNVFKDSQMEFGVTELSRLLDINKSTVHGIVQTLSSYRMLEQDPQTRKYSLGPGLVELGGLAQTRLDLRKSARPELERLMGRTRETVLLGVFEHGGITILDAVEPPRELRITVAAGQRMPYSAGSFGRGFLAWMSEVEVEQLLAEQGLSKYTDSSIVDPEAYKVALSDVRRRGYSLDDTEEYLEGVWAVSVPLLDHGEVLAVVTVVGFSSRSSAREKKRAIRDAKEAVQQIANGLGVSPSGRV